MASEQREATTIQGCRTTRIYCRPSCPAGKHMKPENRIHFKSREEARVMGYRACKICKPDGLDTSPETFFLTPYQSPLGEYIIVSSAQGAVCVEPEEKIPTRLPGWIKNGIMLQNKGKYNDRVAKELDAYFAGQLREFSVPLDLRGSPFQRQVWQLLLAIPYGSTLSYGRLACSLGQAKAARAVGGAVGGNPISILVPCHRVIGANGSLTGYGGGLTRKRALLDLEARYS